MSKLLTISIAAYNAEKYIEKTLNTIAASKNINLIEVFVIDDGGTDATLEIAKSFQSEHPTVFNPIHKENGGYGTTVNYSIEHASGKYFKILDGDDWMHTDGLDNLMEVLKEAEEDIVVTNYYRWKEEEEGWVYYTHNEPEGTVVDIKDGFTTRDPYGMWELVYKTDLLRKSGLKLPAHCLYTDRHYATIPFAFADTLRFTDAKVYCYRLGRDGQSMSVDSQLKHYKERFEGSIELCNFFRKQRDNNNPRCKYLLAKVASIHCQAASVVRFMPKNAESLKILKAYENLVKSISSEIVNEERKNGQFGEFLYLCRKTKYLLYWITPDKVLKKGQGY